MIVRTIATTRRGATALETAIVLLLLFVLIFCIISGGLLIFRYQRVAGLAREAGRWASVRGSEYQRDTNRESPTKQMIFDTAVLPFASGIDPESLTVTITVIDNSTGVETDWDTARKSVRSITAGGEYVTNTVRVTVSSRGTLAFFGDAFTVQSRCDIPLSH